MDEYYMCLIFIAITVIVSFFMGLFVGRREGKHEERMSLLGMLYKIQVTDMTPNTRLHILYVIDDIRRQLKEAWVK